MEYHFYGCVKSDLEKIKYFVESRIRELNRYILDEDKLFEIRLIVNELVINGALHGNELSSKKTVYLNIDFNNERLVIKVRDEGEGIFYDFQEDYHPENMLSTGRGLVLVNGLVDKLLMQNNIIVAIMNMNKQV